VTAFEGLKSKQEEWKAALRTLPPAELVFFSIVLCQVEALLKTKEAALLAGTTEPDMVHELVRFLPYAQVASLTGRAQALAVFDGLLALEAEDVVAAVGGNILRVAKDWSIPRDAVDRALWRSDALTLVNVVEKADDEAINRTLDAAVYAISAGFGTADTVRPVIAVLGDEDADVAADVGYAGVKYLPLGNLGCHRLMSHFLSMAVSGWPSH
jgi:hypothetical protein